MLSSINLDGSDGRHVILASCQQVAATYLSIFQTPQPWEKFFSDASGFPSVEQLFDLDPVLVTSEMKVNEM